MTISWINQKCFRLKFGLKKKFIQLIILMEAAGETVLSENTSNSTTPEETAVLKNVCKAIEPVVETISSTDTKNGGDNAEPEVS